jgi:hypothetical protein
MPVIIAAQIAGWAGGGGQKQGEREQVYVLLTQKLLDIKKYHFNFCIT